MCKSVGGKSASNFTDIFFNPKTQHNTMNNSKYKKNTCEKSIWKISSS